MKCQALFSLRNNNKKKNTKEWFGMSGALRVKVMSAKFLPLSSDISGVLLSL